MNITLASIPYIILTIACPKVVALCNEGLKAPDALSALATGSATSKKTLTITIGPGGPVYIQVRETTGIGASFGVAIRKHGASIFSAYCNSAALLSGNDEFWLQAKYAGDDQSARDVDVFTGVQGALLDVAIFQVGGTVPTTQGCDASDPGKDWDTLLAFRPPAESATAAAKRGQPVLSIANGVGSAVNLDYWGTTINSMPVISGHILSSEELIARVRDRFSTYLDAAFAKFSPFEPVDQSGWKSGTVGTLLLFRVPVPTLGGPSVERLAPVMLGFGSAVAWRFVTLGNHPVSGTREFGIRKRPDGKWEIYTRGADRIRGLWNIWTESPVKDSCL